MRQLTSNGKTTNGLLILKLEAQLLGVVAQSLDTSNLKVDPVLAVESLRTVLGLRGSARAVAVETGTQTSKTNGQVDRGEIGLLRRAGRRLRGRLGSLGGLRRVLAETLYIMRLSASFARTNWNGKNIH